MQLNSAISNGVICYKVDIIYVIDKLDSIYVLFTIDSKKYYAFLQLKKSLYE